MLCGSGCSSAAGDRNVPSPVPGMGMNKSQRNRSHETEKKMTGSSDSNRSESQGGFREGLSAKEGRSKDHDRRNTNRQRGWVRAISVLGTAKSNRHRKTHSVEPGGTGSTVFMHLTRGGLRRESGGGVSRGHSSEDALGNLGVAKGRRTKRRPSASPLEGRRRVGERNNTGVATTATSRAGGNGAGGGFLQRRRAHVHRVGPTAKGGKDEAQ